MQETLDQLKAWWQDLTPETRAVAWDAGVGFVAFLGGLVLGRIVGRTLRSWNFDGAFDISGAPPGQPDRGFTPTRAAALLVRLSVWAAAAWWFLGRYGRPDLADYLRVVGTRIWALIGLLAGALLVGGLVSRRITDALQSSLNNWNPAAARNPAAPHRTVAGAIGAGVYGLVLLLTLLTAADTFDWPLARAAATTLWQLAQQLLTAGGALLIAWLGARWARELATPHGPVTPEMRAGQYVGLVLIAGATLGGMGALLSGRAMLLAFLAVAFLGTCLWLVRGYLPDLMAGRKLRAEKVGQVWIEGAPFRVAGIGLLTSELGNDGETGRVPNRLVLDAAGKGPPVANGRR